MKINRVIKVLFILCYLITVSFCLQSLSTAKMNSHFKLLAKTKFGSSPATSSNKNNAPKTSNDDLQDSAIHFQAWIRYFHYQKQENETKKPNYFFKNESFQRQEKKGSDHSDQVSPFLTHFIYSHFYCIKFHPNTTNSLY